MFNRRVGSPEFSQAQLQLSDGLRARDILRRVSGLALCHAMHSECFSSAWCTTVAASRTESQAAATSPPVFTFFCLRMAAGYEGVYKRRDEFNWGWG